MAHWNQDESEHCSSPPTSDNIAYRWRSNAAGFLFYYSMSEDLRTSLWCSEVGLVLQTTHHCCKNLSSQIEVLRPYSSDHCATFLWSSDSQTRRAFEVFHPGSKPGLDWEGSYSIGKPTSWIRCHAFASEKSNSSLAGRGCELLYLLACRRFEGPRNNLSCRNDQLSTHQRLPRSSVVEEVLLFCCGSPAGWLSWANSSWLIWWSSKSKVEGIGYGGFEESARHVILSKDNISKVKDGDAGILRLCRITEPKPKELLVEGSRTDLHRNGISWTRGERIEGQRAVADHRKTTVVR